MFDSCDIKIIHVDDRDKKRIAELKRRGCRIITEKEMEEIKKLVREGFEMIRRIKKKNNIKISLK